MRELVLSNKASLRDLLKFMAIIAKRYPRNVLVITVLTFVTAIMESVGISMLVPIVERFGFGGNATSDALSIYGLNFGNITLETVLIIFVSIQLIRALLQFWQQDLTVYQEKKIPVDLQGELLRAVVHVRWPSYLALDQGKIINLLVYETKQIGAAFSYTANFFSQVMILLGYLAAGLYLEWRFTSIVMVFGIASLIFFKPLFKRALLDSKGSIHYRNLLQHTANSHLLNLKTIRSMGLENWSLQNFHQISDRIREYVYRTGRNGPMIRLIFEPVAICLLVFGIYLSISQFSMAFSTISVLLLIFIRALPQLSQAQEKIHTAFSLMSSAEAFDHSLKQLRETPERRGGVEVYKIEKAIELHDVSVVIDGKTILSKVRATIPARGVTAIVGPSGSGKSTLLDCILGFFTPSQGDVHVDGHPLSSISLQSWRKIIGYVGHEAHFFELTLKENLLLGDPRRTDEDVWQALRMAGADEFVRNLPGGLEYIVRDGATNFSYGQRQRLALARALVRSPRILILDEATNGLDEATEKSVLDTVRVLGSEIPVLLVTHKVTNRNIADNILELKDGTIISSKAVAASSPIH